MRFWLSGRCSPNGHALKAEGHSSAVLGVDGSEWPVASRCRHRASAQPMDQR